MRAWLVCGVTMLAAGTVQAKSTWNQFIPNGSCAACHTEAPALNAFGADVDVWWDGNEDTNYWPVLYNLDSDDDGFDNGEELGDPCGVWTPGATPAYTTGITNPGDVESVPTEHTADDCQAGTSSSGAATSGTATSAATSGTATSDVATSGTATSDVATSAAATSAVATSAVATSAVATSAVATSAAATSAATSGPRSSSGPAVTSSSVAPAPTGDDDDDDDDDRACACSNAGADGNAGAVVLGALLLGGLVLSLRRRRD